MALNSRLWNGSIACVLSLVVSILTSQPADGFHFLPSGKVFQKAAFSRSRKLHMFPFDRQPSHSHQNDGNHEKYRRNMEFMNLEPVPETEARKARLERDLENKAQFAKYGDELWTLRKKMKKLREELLESINGVSPASEERIRYYLREAEYRDPELVYELELLEMQVARSKGDMELAEEAGRRALNARSCLPQYNLEGLWVGKYGNHGYEMINVTYVGDTLIAFKVTGDRNVPRGEISFQADLSPPAIRRLREIKSVGGKSKKSKDRDGKQKPLEPIVLTEKAANKWGTRQLPRYRGLGQVAEEGFHNHRWMDGQLIIIGDDYFSFAWVVSSFSYHCFSLDLLYSWCSHFMFSIFQYLLLATGKSNLLW
jgi:hypothetical protein